MYKLRYSTCNACCTTYHYIESFEESAKQTNDIHNSNLPLTFSMVDNAHLLCGNDNSFRLIAGL